MTVNEYWAEVVAELRQRRLDDLEAAAWYPAYPWDVHGGRQEPPMPVSYALAAVQRIVPTIDLPSVRLRVHQLMGVAK